MREALKPADWGSGFTKSDPYESGDLNRYVPDASCNLTNVPMTNAFATLARYTTKSDGAVSANSEFTTYKAVESAQYQLGQDRETLRQCKTQKSGKERYEDVHQVAIPELKGFDEVVTEEGHYVSDPDGKKVDYYYTDLRGRKGNFVMQADVTRPTGAGTQEQNRNDAVSALLLMLSRLEGGASQQSP
ncbi:hypothetical protein [Streptomyces sp. NPDC050355]|uniref:hypothetical protein n=1 Tax=Streptomyces sp. NPDC050355 TaxID=3365609 RepID=UPI00378DDC2D